MAIPPGNKLIGYAGIGLAYRKLVGTADSAAADGATAEIRIANNIGVAIVKNPAALPQPESPKKLSIGAVGISAAYTKGPDCIKVSNLLGLAVVKYEPPTDLLARNVLSTAVVVNTTGVFNVQPVKNAQIGVSNLELRYTVDPVPKLTLQNLAGFVVVKYHAPYKTTSLVNIEYAAHAKLNTEDLL